ncbi:hypothetical protein GCM10025870_11540 [Agromyces marinus]|uniref:Uncharacterized protein n=1 Tax=Agromyces marinus TaxID=1389020 RepID=A0ABN6YAL4_9MICO|nr:hypothetical protein GCM10025870_11540 [Agromyces marinus]
MPVRDLEHGFEVLGQHADDVERHAGGLEDAEPLVDVVAPEPARVGSVVDEVADAAEAHPAAEFLEAGCRPLGFVQRDVADHPEHARLGLGDGEHVLGVVVVVGGLDEHGAGHARPRERRQDLRHLEVAVEHAGLGRQPAVLRALEAPDVLVRVDDPAHAASSVSKSKDLMITACSSMLCPWPARPRPTALRSAPARTS